MDLIDLYMTLERRLFMNLLGAGMNSSGSISLFDDLSDAIVDLYITLKRVYFLIRPICQERTGTERSSHVKL
jgi:hypothetical protein